MKYVLIYIIKVYQLSFGLFFRGACKFSPTCSEYMRQSILSFGVIRGVWKGVRRLSKCHPYSKQFGIDEV